MENKQQTVELAKVLDIALEDFMDGYDFEGPPEDDPHAPGWVVRARQILSEYRAPCST